jgi:large subunit ribosomal protein L6
MSGNEVMVSSGVAERIPPAERPLSRVGRQPIPIPSGVTVEVIYGGVVINGPRGTVTQKYHPEVKVRVEGDQVIVERLTDRKFHHSLHGLTRSLVANAVVGVTEGYSRTLELMGVGYRVQQNGDGITLSVGYSHTVDVFPEDGLVMQVEGNNRVHITGVDKQKVGQLAAKVRRVRPPNAYKEKGIRYQNEILRLKPGKAAARRAV